MWGKIALVAKTWYNLCKICSQAGLYQIPPKIQEWKLVIKDKFGAKFQCMDYTNMDHGFMTRGQLSDSAIKNNVTKAFE